MKINIVVGTRPQIIKSSPIIHRLTKEKLIETQIVHTGQHYDYLMSQIFFNELQLPSPIINLGVGSGLHGEQTAEMLKGLEKFFLESKPDLVLVPGDTNSTLSAALAAVKLHIPIAHIEAGARSYDMSMPEEVNRVVTDHCSNILFTVSENCSKNLRKEGFDDKKIHLVGDTMFESIRTHEKDIQSSEILDKINVQKKGYGILTLHRQDNVENPDKLEKIIKTIKKSKLPIIFVCHPRTRSKLQETMRLKNAMKFKILEPVDYFTMLNLIKNAKVILTDSGGIQKEAYWLKTPCITLRENTEWIETIEAGANILVGSDPRKIQNALNNLPNSEIIYSSELRIPNPSIKILNIIRKYFD